MKYTPKGYKIPEAEDQDFWEQNEYNVERLDAHDHDGLNSEKLVPGATAPYKVTVEVADWVGSSAPFSFDIEFPLSWNMTWTSGEPSPVRVMVFDEDGIEVHLSTARLAAGDGVRVYTSVKADYTVGLY